jgi:hypothetical protein
MGIIAENNKTVREPMPAGVYLARCFSMIEIGTVTSEYKGVEKSLKKIRITWEFPEELKVFKEENGEQPYVISQEFTLSMYEKANLRKFLEAWRGKGFTEDQAKAFDVTALLGVPCNISVIHNPSKKDASIVYANIGSISPLKKSEKCPAQINPTFMLSYTDWDDEKFNSLPDFIKDEMKKTPEYQALKNPGSFESNSAPTTEDESSDLPF